MSETDPLVSKLLRTDEAERPKSYGLVVAAVALNPIEQDLRFRAVDAADAAAPWPILFWAEGDLPDEETFEPLARYCDGRIPGEAEAMAVLDLIKQVREHAAEPFRPRIEIARSLGRNATPAGYAAACLKNGVLP